MRKGVLTHTHTHTHTHTDTDTQTHTRQWSQRGWGEQVEFLSATLSAVSVASAMAAPLAAGHEGDGDA